MPSYLKTKETNEDVLVFLNSIEDAIKKQDCFQLLNMMSDIWGLGAKMWGSKIVGLGKYNYKTKAGKAGEWFLIGFSPRKNDISLHLMFGLEDQTELLDKLGKHSMGKGCLYLKKLSDVDTNSLQEIMKIDSRLFQFFIGGI